MLWSYSLLYSLINTKTAAGLLVSAPREISSDSLRQRSAANASSVTLTADVGSWTHTQWIRVLPIGNTSFAYSATLSVHVWHPNTTPWVKKQDTKLLPITSPNINRFLIFFTFRLSRKFVTKPYLNTPPHPKRVATLPCEISMFKKSQFLKSTWWSKLLCKT